MAGKVIKRSFPFPSRSLDYPLIQNEHLEVVAKMYTAKKWMQSPLLERLIIDALLFNEASVFALTIVDLPPQNFIQFLIAFLLKPLKPVVYEIFSLGITWAISNIIDSTVGMTFWIVFGTITLGRWLNPVKANDLIQTQKPKLLLADMLSALDRLKHPEFNGKLLRELLYDLEKRGAVNRPAVFNVLDKKIERESAQ
ncbi:MAG: hypothetical protein PHE96_02045 [Methylococcales bacterium]|nr:hypothetical protein [Methylococcales bacterium]